MDIIYLNDLRVDTTIGVYDRERRIRQTLVLDLEIGTDFRKAAASDKIEDTVDYQAVAERIVNFAGTSEFKLVETLAEKIADILIREFEVPWCRLRLNKQGALRGVRDVGVVIERGRNT